MPIVRNEESKSCPYCNGSGIEKTLLGDTWCGPCKATGRYSSIPKIKNRKENSNANIKK